MGELVRPRVQLRIGEHTASEGQRGTVRRSGRLGLEEVVEALGTPRLGRPQAECVAEPPVLLAERRKCLDLGAGVRARRLGEDLEAAGESRHVLFAEQAPIGRAGAHARFRRRNREV